VSSKGEFYVKLPADMLDIAQQYVLDNELSNKVVDRMGCVVYADSLRELTVLANAICEVFYGRAVTEDLVICYTTGSSMTAWLHDGRVEVDEEYLLRGPKAKDPQLVQMGSPSSGREPASVSVGVEVRVRETCTADGKTSVTYRQLSALESLADAEHREPLPGGTIVPDYAARLVYWGAGIPGWWRGHLPDDVRVIPCTEANANFFHDMLVAMFNTAMRLQSALGDQDRLQSTISAGTKLIGG
jgi:hypothetical protein